MIKYKIYILISIFNLFLLSCRKDNVEQMAIFDINDLFICDLKLPNGYPQSQTHAGIGYVEDSLCGYQYWLVSTPYPNITPGYGDQFENPMLYFANEDKTIPPTVFTEYEYNPLVERPIVYSNTSYNSDPDIFIEDSVVHILYRTYQTNYPFYNKSKYSFDKLSICYIKSNIKNNVLQGFSNPKELLTANLGLYNDLYPYISPSLTFYKNKYRLFYLVTNTYNNGKPTKGLVMLSGDNIENVDFNYRDINLLNGDLNPWHMSVFKYKEKLYSIVCCTKNGKKKLCYQYLAEFDEMLNTFTIYQKPLLDIPSYRGSAIVTNEGEFVLYTSVIWNNKLSKSIDGRDIVMARMPFDELLEKLKHE